MTSTVTCVWILFSFGSDNLNQNVEQENQSAFPNNPRSSIDNLNQNENKKINLSSKYAILMSFLSEYHIKNHIQYSCFDI
jgi:hypothetical protein